MPSISAGENAPGTVLEASAASMTLPSLSSTVLPEMRSVATQEKGVLRSENCMSPPRISSMSLRALLRRISPLERMGLTLNAAMRESFKESATSCSCSMGTPAQ